VTATWADPLTADSCNLLAHDRPERQELGAVFEVHAIEMIPVTAPDEAVLLEDLHDLDGTPALVNQRNLLLPNLLLAHAVGQSILPVATILRVDVDGDPERMDAQARGPRNASEATPSSWQCVFSSAPIEAV